MGHGCHDCGSPNSCECPRQQAEPQIARHTEAEELIEKLRKTALWLEIRGILVKALQTKIDTDIGSGSIEKLTAFVEEVWRPGSAPQAVEIGKLLIRLGKIQFMLLKTLEALYSLGRWCPDIVHEAERLGMDIPEHLHG